MATKNRGTSSGHMIVHEAKVEKPKPSFRVTEDELPEIKDWTVGKKYRISIEVEMRSHSKGDRYGYDEGAKKKHEADLVVLSCEPEKEEEKKEK